MTDTPNTTGRPFPTLVVSFLRPLAISAALFTAIYFLMGARFGYVDPFILLICALIGLVLALPYGVAGILIQLMACLAKEHAALARSFLSPFFYGGVTGAYMHIYNQNHRMFSYHEQPFVMPSWLNLFSEGVETGILCGVIGIGIYALVTLGKRILQRFRKLPSGA